MPTYIIIFPFHGVYWDTQLQQKPM